MTALSINQKKRLRSLSRKKVRAETGLFLVEGDKIVRELLNPLPGNIPYRVESIFASPEWLDRYLKEPGGGINIIALNPSELKQVSGMQEPNQVMAVVEQASHTPNIQRLGNQLSIGLEEIRDPGNLGTIVRTADWFGIRDVFCSTGSVELYNPKVIQASMGSFLRVRVHYLELGEFIPTLRLQANDIEGTVNDDFGILASGGGGHDIFSTRLPRGGFILLGNEARGLSGELIRMADLQVSIPSHDPDLRAESLNVASAAAILCAEFRRQASSKAKRE
jgi:TrmH family RNA methyltransferase